MNFGQKNICSCCHYFFWPSFYGKKFVFSYIYISAGVKVPTLKLEVGSNTVDINKYINADGVANTTSTVLNATDFYGFPETWTMAYVDIASETVEEITITSGGQDLSIEDLYDGLMLTEEGHDFFSMLKEADALPKATKAYLKELLSQVEIGSLNKVTVNLVVGKSVLNKSLERELRGLGFDVVRYGGDNREETSLEVAEAIEDATNTKERFVVGAEGEADAMSIASVASEIKAPIIVSKKGGISENAVSELSGQDLIVIGGENVFSNYDMKQLKAEASSITRIAGENRKATNAEIINKFYTNDFVGEAETVIVAKDGQRNKDELIDALTAANMAASVNAPIILATDSLSKEQINALELNAKESYALYQVGYGVDRNAIKTIAECIGLTNR